MNTSEYKSFLHICNRNLNNSDFEVFNPKSTIHSTFNDIDKLKNQAYRVRQKFINNIVDNLLLFEKNLLSNKGKINWCLSYEDFTEQLLDLLSNKKIKSEFDSLVNAVGEKMAYYLWNKHEGNYSQIS